MKPLYAAAAVCCTLGGFTPPADADENLFGYTYGAETLPRGGKELYQWITYRADKGQGTYRAFDFNTEFEYGFTDRLQGSFYLNAAKYKIAGAAPLDSSGNPEYPDTDATRFKGVQAALKYNVLSPYKDGIGLAFYIEPGYSRVHKVNARPEENYSLELKAILQKNFFDDQLVWALNLSSEPEWRHWKDIDASEKELELEATSGLSYRVAPKWFVGVDTRYHSEYPDFSKREHWAFFAGPTLHYGDKRWWWTLTWLPQIEGAPIDPARSHSLHLDEHEKNEYRLKVGYNF